MQCPILCSIIKVLDSLGNIGLKEGKDMKIGYARVSSTGQNLEIQNDKLTESGCEKIFKEKRSATNMKRPILKECLSFAREGDCLVVTKLDRFARSTSDLLNMINFLKEKNVGFKVLNNTAIDTTTSEGRLMISVLASIAEFENELRKERQAEGIKKAQSKGVKFGVKPKLSAEQIKQMKLDKENGYTISQLKSKYDLSKSSIYRLVGHGDLKLEFTYTKNKPIYLSTKMEESLKNINVGKINRGK